jgi:hypothetical protein
MQIDFACYVVFVTNRMFAADSVRDVGFFDIGCDSSTWAAALQSCVVLFTIWNYAQNISLRIYHVIYTVL